MKLKLEENLPAELVDRLRTGGHDAMTVGEQGLTGAADDVLLEQVRHEGRLSRPLCSATCRSCSNSILPVG